jgi:8-oxo-dGTP pyrophosphatase MutT (NUDIX family)
MLVSPVPIKSASAASTIIQSESKVSSSQEASYYLPMSLSVPLTNKSGKPINMHISQDIPKVHYTSNSIFGKKSSHRSFMNSKNNYVENSKFSSSSHQPIEAPIKILQCQRYGCAQDVNLDLPHAAFCSIACMKEVLSINWESAGMLFVLDGSKLSPSTSQSTQPIPVICIGSDRGRRNGRPIDQGYGLEIFGGSRDSTDKDAIETAIRETREESGLDFDQRRMHILLEEAPLIVKAFPKDGRQVYYVIFLVHLEKLELDKMYKAWQSRVLHGAPYASTEMDRCFFLQYVKNGNSGQWQFFSTNNLPLELDGLPLSSAIIPRICKYHLPVLEAIVESGLLESSLELLPTLNSLKIWEEKRYICK